MSTLMESRLSRITLLHLFSAALVGGGTVALAASLALGLNRPTIGVALLASGVLSLWFLRRGAKAKDSETAVRARFSPIRAYGPASITILLAPTVWVLSHRNDVAFFAAMSLGAALLVRPIFDVRTTRGAATCLAAVMLLHLELLWRMQQFSTGPIGIDTWFHLGIIRDIVASGGIPATAGAYSAFPFFHLFGAQMAVLLNLSPFLSLALISTTMALAPVFLFLASRPLLSINGALLAALVFAVSDFFLLWTIWIIPTSLGVMFFALVIYAALSIPHKSWPIRIVLIVAMTAIIVLHPLVTILAIVALVLFLIPRRTTDAARRRRDALNLGPLAVTFAILAFAWWVYSLGPGEVDVVAEVVVALSRVLETFSLGTTAPVTSAANLSYAAVLGRDLGLVAILVIFPVGLVILGRKPSVNFGDTLRVGLPAVTFMAAPFVLGVTGQSAFLPDRWFIFGYVFASITSAISIMYLRNPRGRKRVTLVPCLVIGLLVLVMISDPLGNVTRPTYGQTYQVSNYFTDGEIQAPAFLASLPNYNRVITDRAYANLVLKDWYEFNGRITMLTPSFSPSDLNQSDLLLVRISLQGEPVLVGDGHSPSYYDYLPGSFWWSLAKSGVASRVYDDGSAWAYVGN